MANRYHNIRFFDSESNDLNLIYNDDLNILQGVSYLPLVSVGLYETLTLHILEEVIGTLGEKSYITPIAEVSGDVSFKFKFKDDYNTSEDVFLYSAIKDAGELYIQKDKMQSSSLLLSSNSVSSIGNSKVVHSNLPATPITAHVALTSEVEGFHIRTLSILEVVDGVETREIAQIKVYGEVEGEDDRLKSLLSNMGMNLDDLDYFIFKESNIQEQSPDFILLNQKRKELLLQASKIKPFIGTYKALLSAIDFFGYDKITLKEYWLNINEQSENFGKLKAVAIPNQDVVGFLANKNKGNELPNSNQKKTSRFSLVYRLNTPTGVLDEWDIPTVEETIDYSPDEVLIKLYGLKNKLQKDYLPLQAKIVDITGEGDYFSQFNQNVWNNQHNIKVQNAGVEFRPVLKPEARNIFMEDLRKVDHRLTGFNQDFNAITPADKLSIVESIKEFYGDYYNNSLNTFNTIAGIPIGAPISLHVEGVEDQWKLAEFTWEDAKDAEVSNAVQSMETDKSTEGVEKLNNYLAEHDATVKNLLTWSNWWHRGVYEIEWVLIGPRDYKRYFRGPIAEYNNIPLTLPYTGSYTVETNLYDLYNVKSTKINKEWIEVKNKNVEVYGLTQLATKQLDFKDYKYSWDKAGSNWDWSRENVMPVSDVIATYYNTLDRANYIHDESSVGIEHSTVRRYLDSTSISGFSETAGPYQWASLKNHVWEDGPEVTWEMTRVGSDINSSFQLNLLEMINGDVLTIEQKNPSTGIIVKDSYTITNTIPSLGTDIPAWELISTELRDLDRKEHPILSKFNYNPILKDNDNDGDEDVCLYILVVGEEPSRSYDFSSVEVTGRENAIAEIINFKSYNPSFDDTYIINNLAELHSLNHVTFSYDLSNMPGIVDQQWTLSNSTSNIEDIYYSNPILTYLFKDKGYYTVSLDLKDSNGNKNTIIKNILKII
jgi:hypothetical protein